MNSDNRTEEELRDARRSFMRTCGKFAVVTPAAMTLLMAANRQSYATAGSNNGFRKGHGNNGFGNGGNDGVPGNSNHQDETR